jgi:hypothetical protein
LDYHGYRWVFLVEAAMVEEIEANETEKRGQTIFGKEETKGYDSPFTLMRTLKSSIKFCRHVS